MGQNDNLNSFLEDEGMKEPEIKKAIDVTDKEVTNAPKIMRSSGTKAVRDEDEGYAELKKYKQLVTIRPIKLYRRGGSMQGVSVIPGAKKMISAYRDSHGHLITGHTVKECEAYTFAKINDEFWNRHVIILNDSEKVLDISKQEDLLDYKLLKAHFMVANSPEEVNANTKFVMFDEEAEAEKKVKLVELEVEALSFLKEMNQVQQADFLRLYGDKPRSMKPSVIFSRLADKAKRNPQDFIARYKDPDKKTKVLIIALTQAEILRREGLSFYYGQNLIGASLERAVDWFNAHKNQEMVVELISMLDAKSRIL